MPLLAIVSRDPTVLPRWLTTGESALAGGWGGAIFHRGTREWCTARPAHRGARPSELELRGDVLVAQLDAAGAPLARAGWIFGHGGAPRARENRAERIFTHLLARLEGAGVLAAGSDSAIDAVLRDATAELIADRAGPLDFVLSNGALLYAHRFGPPLYLIRQQQPAAILIASEPLTDEPWVALEDGALVRCRTGEDAVLVALRGVDPVPAEPSSQPELPFTD